MTEHLWPLLRLKAASNEELIQQYRQVYLETYVGLPDEPPIVVRNWHGERVLFHAPTFDHAFTESGNYRLSAGVHDRFSLPRARRILWIREVLGATAGTIERRLQRRPDSRGRLRKRRSLLVVEERYLVVLQETTGAAREQAPLEFVTAFPADASYIATLRQETALAEIKKPQSSGD